MILFDLVKLQKVRPWDVNLANLLSSLIGEMAKTGYIDFKASGTALLSSSTIYRMKSELVLDLQEPPQVVVEKPVEFLPPPIRLPYRFEYTSTSVENLLNALEAALTTEPIIDNQPKLVPIIPAPPVIHELDEFMVELEDRIEEIYQKIIQFTKEDKMIPFSKLTSGLRKLEIIRIFLLILFIACRGKIQLWQEEDFGEVYISLA